MTKGGLSISFDFKDVGSEIKKIIQPLPYEFPCSKCKGDATIAYGSDRGDTWDGLVKKGERLCLVCGRKRGIKFFGG